MGWNKRAPAALILVCSPGIAADPVVTESTVTSKGEMTTRVESPPPSAISPQFSSGSGDFLCTVGVAGAVQTQILGISAGTTFTEANCLRLRNAAFLYDAGMKVAAVSLMCQDPDVWASMEAAGTPCPIQGRIGAEAAALWKANPDKIPGKDTKQDNQDAKKLFTIGGVLSSLAWLLLL